VITWLRVCVNYAIWLVLSSTCHFLTDNLLQSADADQQEMCAVAEKPHDADVKFKIRNVQRHRTVLPAIAWHLVDIWSRNTIQKLISIIQTHLCQGDCSGGGHVISEGRLDGVKQNLSATILIAHRTSFGDSYISTVAWSQNDKALTSNTFPHECHDHSDYDVWSYNMKSVFQELVPCNFGCTSIFTVRCYAEGGYEIAFICLSVCNV